ncbi:UNVERIFIED_CONTAM: hypothetical protein K2H54_015690 [Gekko kuhli]
MNHLKITTTEKEAFFFELVDWKEISGGVALRVIRLSALPGWGAGDASPWSFPHGVRNAHSRNSACPQVNPDPVSPSAESLWYGQLCSPFASATSLHPRQAPTHKRGVNSLLES